MLNLVKVFALSMLLAGGGALGGGVAGMLTAPGGLIIGGLLAGTAGVVLAGYLATRWCWLARGQRLWSILGGGFGFALAWMVTLATIMTPGALIGSIILVGVGAVMGAVVGASPHAGALTRDSRGR